MVGTGMAISGAVLQTVTRNELAEPGILGINAGAGLTVVLYITLFQGSLSNMSLLSTFAMPFFAFLGAMLDSCFDSFPLMEARLAYDSTSSYGDRHQRRNNSYLDGLTAKAESS